MSVMVSGRRLRRRLRDDVEAVGFRANSGLPVPHWGSTSYAILIRSTMVARRKS